MTTYAVFMEDPFVFLWVYNVLADYLPAPDGQDLPSFYGHQRCPFKSVDGLRQVRWIGLVSLKTQLRSTQTAEWLFPYK